MSGRDRQSASRSPRNAGDLDDFVSLESELAAATDRIAAFARSLDAARADAAAQAARADRAERNLASSTERIDELERALARRRAPDVEEVTDLALRHAIVSMRILALRSARGGAAANNDRTPVDEAGLIARRGALQEVIACRLGGTEASARAEHEVAREMAGPGPTASGAVERAEREIDATEAAEAAAAAAANERKDDRWGSRPRSRDSCRSTTAGAGSSPGSTRRSTCRPPGSTASRS